MTPIELAHTMLGEVTTTAFTQARDTYGFNENKEAATDGGKIAGNARKNIEDKLGESVVSEQNYLTKSQKSKRLSMPDVDPAKALEAFMEVSPKKK